MTKSIAVSTPADTNEEAAEFRSKLNRICASAIGGQEWGALSRALVAIERGELVLVPREVYEARGLDELMGALRTVENFVKGEDKMTIRDKALTRVRSWDKLKAHEDTIMYDWPEGDEHWEWVCKAPTDEIVEWAKGVEDYNAEQDALAEFDVQ